MRKGSPGQRERKEYVKETKPNLSSIPVSSNFVSANDIRTALKSQDVEVLTKALKTLRNQLSITPDEETLTPQDHRLLLAKSWLEKSPGAQDIFSIIDGEPKAKPGVASLCLSVLSALINLLSTHFVYHAFGESIVKNLLSLSHMQQLNSNLVHTNSDLILSTLQVILAMSEFAGGIEKRTVMDGFAWGQKTLQKLLFLRGKSEGGRKVNPLGRPDIRTLCIFFTLSFLSKTTPAPIKLSLLEKHRETFLLIFKGIHRDSYVVVRRILEVCWEGVWDDPKIKRTLKVGLFNESTFSHLLKLYDRRNAEGDNVDHVPADVIHHFMLIVATHPGVGICFKDQGWYPRDNSSEETAMQQVDMDIEAEHDTSHGKKIYNKILAHIVKGLKVNEDARQQELALRILDACPELVTNYWSAVNLTLEPRLSSRWITNISILGTIISLPIPASTFLLPHSIHHNPSSPPLPSILANVLPHVLNKTQLTKGLQSPWSLVQHCTALALSKCLCKLDNVLTTFREIATKLEEDTETGQWSKRSRELVGDVEKRVPEFMVIVGMIQQKAVIVLEGHHTARAPLLTESALRLLWLYHKLFPRLVAEVRFDVGKLLLSVFEPTIDFCQSGNDENSLRKHRNGIDILRQLHVLRLLKESDNFAWSSRAGSSSHSYLHIILTLYSKTPCTAVRDSAGILVTHLLSSSVLFSHDLAELDLWLGALPSTWRTLGAAAPDGTPLTDESLGILTFLDECIQRCLKTPYRYLEDTLVFFEETKAMGDLHEDSPMARNDPKALPSPLLMAVLEQLRAKLVANVLSPSDILAIVTFMRKLTCGLTSKFYTLGHARRISSKVDEILSTPSAALNSSALRNAIKRESRFLSHTLHFIQDAHHHHTSTSTSSLVQEFLLKIESLPPPSSNETAIKTAYEIVDWMRIIDAQLHPSEVKRLYDTIARFSPLALTEFFYQLDPRFDYLWPVVDGQDVALEFLPFEWASLHSTPTHLLRGHVKNTLTSLFSSPKRCNNLPERRISIILHRLAVKNATSRHAELSLLVSIMYYARSQLGAIDSTRLKQALFLQSDSIKEFCCSQEVSVEELAELSNLVRVSLDPQSDSDRKLALAYCNHWVAEFEALKSLHLTRLASPWIPFMEPMDVVRFLDVHITAAVDNKPFTDTEQNVLAVILNTLTRLSSDQHVLTELQRRIPGLQAIRQSFRHNAIDALLLQIVAARLPMGCNVLPSNIVSPCTISDITRSAQQRWNMRFIHLPLDSALISTFLHSTVWDETVAKIISEFIYVSQASRRHFWTWLKNNEPPEAPSMDLTLVPLHACLDVMSLQGESCMIQLPKLWLSAVVRCLIRTETSDRVRALCASCIRILFQALPSNRADFLAQLSGESCHRDGTDRFMNPHVVRLLRDLYRLDVPAFSDTMTGIVHEGLKWIVGQFSGDDTSQNDMTVFSELCQLVSSTRIDTQAVEPVIKAAIQYCLHMPNIIRCLIMLVSSVHLTPASVNRHLQSIVQHSQLYRAADPSLPSREPTMELLHMLFSIYPTNTCQPSHIMPLAHLYGGTMSFSDRLLLSVFYLYENQRKVSVASIFRSWSPRGSSLPSHDVVRAITGLDPAKVFRTCTNFPTRRRVDDIPVKNFSANEDILYDPVFLTLLVIQLLSDNKRLSATQWVQIFRSNILSLVICVLTSRDDAFRKVGVTTLAGVLRRVEEADFMEKSQVIYIMHILQDLLPPRSISLSSTPRLPTFPVALLAHALHATFYPSGFLYPIISRFLLQRPELDATDVPMLYSLLYSNEDGDWAKERMWMIKFLMEAMDEGSAQDWMVFKRRHTWDIIVSMWQATRIEETSLRKGILELLVILSSNPHAIGSLILRSSFITWIEMQLELEMANEAEYIAWVKILENVIVTADVTKTEKATLGEFTAAFGRCLRLLLAVITVSGPLVSQVVRLQWISRVLLRLASRSNCPRHFLADVLKNATDVLQTFEMQILWISDIDTWNPDNSEIIPEPPHRAGRFLDIPGGDGATQTWCALRSWAKSTVTLWKVAMVLDQSKRPQDVKVWEALTCRLLVLRASPWFNSWCPNEDEESGEWVRRETLLCLLDGRGN